MNYWMKFFNDGTKEKGTDADIANRNASWSRGRLKGIKAAIINYAGTIIKVYGTDIWQKDQFVSHMNLPGRKIARSLGVRIMYDDVGKLAYIKHEGNHVYVLDLVDKLEDHAIVIEPEDVGKWLVLKISRVGTVGLSVEEKYRV